MTYTRSFENYKPPRRFDGLPYTVVDIEESAEEVSGFAVLETKALSPLDADPTDPQARSFTTALAVLEAAWYRLTWRDASAAEFTGDPVYFSPAGALQGRYASPDQLRTALEMDATVLPDAQANRHIIQAEILIDSMLGAREVDYETGRKVSPEEVDDPTWEKLEMATIELASFLHENPGWARERRHGSTGGDISLGQPFGSPFPIVTALLDASGLRRLHGRAGGRRTDSVIGNLPEPD